MTSVKPLATVAGLVTSLIVIFESYTSTGGGTILAALLLAGVLFFIDALVCLYGVRQAFYGGAVLSVAVIILDLLLGTPFAAGWLVVIVLSVVTLGLDIVAIRTRSKMPEQGNPMNLPVFG